MLLLWIDVCVVVGGGVAFLTSKKFWNVKKNVSNLSSSI